MKKVALIVFLLLFPTGCKTLATVKQDCQAATEVGEVSTTCKLILALSGD